MFYLHEAKVTHKAPRTNTPRTATFSPAGSLRDSIGVIGRSRMIVSVAIEKPALAYQFFSILMQDPGTDLSHALSTGVHWNTDAKNAAIMYAVTMPMRP